MAELREFEAQLKEPFALDDIDFLPKGKIEKEGKTLCMALPYADPRVYQDRLNAVAYGEWSTPAPVVVVAGNRLVCYVTVILCGVAHTDVGEATNNEENTGTEAWAQAFKRACSQFGLGRYLYTLEKEWVPFNPQRKVIDLDPAQKAAVVKKMYQKAGIALPGSNGKALHALTQPGSYEQHEAAQANGQQEEAQSSIPSVKQLQARCTKLCGTGYWQAMLKVALKLGDGVTLLDKDITIAHRISIHKYLEFVDASKPATP